jgi:hypothetical protein
MHNVNVSTLKPAAEAIVNNRRASEPKARPVASSCATGLRAIEFAALKTRTREIDGNHHRVPALVAAKAGLGAAQRGFPLSIRYYLASDAVIEGSM